MKNFIIAIQLLLTCFDASSQNVGIGTTTPVEKLDIVGHIKIIGEIKPNGIAGQAGQVLTSNGNGTMKWAEAATSTAGNGGWGDCSVNNIDSYFPVRNPNAQIGDRMGKSVSISGDYAIVGAYNDSEGGFNQNGSATIFKRNTVTGAWESQVKLINPNSETSDYFGQSVSISGDYAIVGSPYDDEGGLNENGSATIFKINSTSGVWESQGKLINPAAASSDFFGWSVSISGDYAIVGAVNDADAGGVITGSATIFKRNTVTGIWESQGKLTNPALALNDVFGYSVSISGDYAIVGSPEDDEVGNIDNGSATVFKRNTSTGVWESQGKLINSLPQSVDHFGCAVSISGDYAIVGSLDDDEPLTNNGSITIFKRNTVTGVWENQAKLVNPSTAQADAFGFSVAISGDYAIVGANKDDDATGNTDNGSVTIFKRYENAWFGYQKFSYPNSNNNSFFGTAVSIDGASSRFVVGAEGFFSNMGAAFFGKVK